MRLPYKFSKLYMHFNQLRKLEGMKNPNI